MQLKDIVYHLRRIRDDLDGQQWSTWKYVEGCEMWGDLKDMVATLNLVISELEKR